MNTSLTMLRARLPGFLLLLAGVALLIMALTHSEVEVLERALPSGFWALKRTGVRTVVVVWCALLLFFGALQLVFPLQHPGTVLRAAWRSSVGRMRWYSSRAVLLLKEPWVLAALLVAVLVRAVFLDQPLRYDEADTFLRFLDRGVLDLFYYPVPNNHVLHTLLTKASVLLFGSGTAALRLPAFVLGLLAVPLFTAVARRMGSSGRLGTWLMALWPFLILYATNARGYALQVFIVLLLLYGIEGLLRRPTREKAVLLGLVAAAGLFTMPSMLFPLLGLGAWVLYRALGPDRSGGLRLIGHGLPFAMTMVAVTLLLYSPVFLVSNGVVSITRNYHVLPQEWPVFRKALGPHLLRTAEAFVRDVPWWVLVPVLICTLYALGVAVVRREGKWSAMLPALVLGSAIMLIYNHRVPFDRTWIYFLPILFLFADRGYTLLVGLLSSAFQFRVQAALHLAVAAWALALVLYRPVQDYPDTGLFLNAAPTADLMAGFLKPQDKIVAIVPSNVPLYYHLHRLGIRYGEEGEGGITYVVVDTSVQQLNDITTVPCVLVHRLGSTLVYRAEGAVHDPTRIHGTMIP